MLPLLPPGATRINDWVGVDSSSDTWTCFLGCHPIARHAASDRRMFQVTTAQLIDAGSCREAEVVRAFGVSKSSVARALRRYRGGGVEAFFGPRPGRRGGTVLNDEVAARAQSLFDRGASCAEVAAELGVKRDTLRKAVADGRLRVRAAPAGADKSGRSAQDAAAADGMGTACTRVCERVLASLGKLHGAPARFEPGRDVPFGGVLCALPALLANGLLEGVGSHLNPLRGYYTETHVLLLMGFMALCRIKTVEQLRGEAPGEFGMLLGLDRVPEVRCLRRKLSELGTGDAAGNWAAHLSRQWMEDDPQAAGTLYVDGHVRVYHGSMSAPPRRYVSRQRLCLRGISDYWVNDAVGRPFFVVEKTVDPGMLEALRRDIVPRLLRDVPGQPPEEELARDPRRCRFVLVFDREGYSPEFFAEMWRGHRVGCVTYHKHPGGDWPAEWFRPRALAMPGGETVEVRLAEMGSLVGAGKAAVWMREVRKLTEGGHQVSLVSTAFDLDHADLAARLFTRWCQENFLRYMMQHFALDLLGEYATAPLPDTERVVNPAWRELDKRRRATQGTLTQRQAKFAALTLHPEPETDPVRFGKWVLDKARLLEGIEACEARLRELKESLGGTARHIQWGQLPEGAKFESLAPTRRRLLDTIRMVAYRAETAMVPLLRDAHTDAPAARTLLQDLFRASADIAPDPGRKRLRVSVHRSARPASDKRLLALFDELNAAEIPYPGTDLVLDYELVPLPAAGPNMVSEQIPRGKEV